MPQNPPAVAPEYRAFTRDELAALPADTIVAQVYDRDQEPELFRHSPAPVSPWVLLTASPQDYEWERWTLDEVHSEHALYAVIYQPA